MNNIPVIKVGLVLMALTLAIGFMITKEQKLLDLLGYLIVGLLGASSPTNLGASISTLLKTAELSNKREDILNVQGTTTTKEKETTISS